MKTRYGVILAVWLVALTGVGQQTWHVSTNGSDANTGADWSQAWASISNAMTNAAANDVILVSNGTYIVTTEILVNKAVTISGFPANTNTIVTKGTAGAHRIFNIAHTGAVVEYLTITNGNGNASYGGGAIYMNGGTLRNCRVERNTISVWGYGGAMYITGSSIVSNCLVRLNNGGGYGFGIYMNSANCRIVECVFIDNGWVTSGVGGGINMTAGIVERCQFYNNRATDGGGGVYMTGGTVKDCTFGPGHSAVYNRGGAVFMTDGMLTNSTLSTGTTGAYRAGGAVAVAGANALVVSCTITNNRPAAWVCYYAAGLYMTAGTVRNTVIAKNELPNYASDGGGVYMTGGRLVSCTIADNKNFVVNLAGGGTGSGGGIFCTGGAITNCIIYGNTTAKVGDDDNIAGTDVTNACWYSCSPGLSNTENFNITNNPLFATDGSYRLQSKAGRWTPSGWVTDAQNSPCIDQGPPVWDFSLEPAYNGGRINMGFDANTALASKSSSPRKPGAVIQIR